MRDSSIAAHPVTVFVGTWAFVFLLYSLGLSEQLIYSVSDFSYVFLAITGPFLLGYWYVQRMLTLASRANPTRTSAPAESALEPAQIKLMWRRTLGLLTIWGLMSVVEIVFSGGLPIVWLVTGSSKSYRDFGIPSLHGLLMSVLMACATVSFLIYLETKQRRYLTIPFLGVAWFILSITRAFMMGLILQLLFLGLARKPLTGIQITKIFVGFICLVIVFGYIGDLRNGEGLIRAIGRPTDRFPDWLPTGFLWAYIYLATPLNNLFNTIELNPWTDHFTLAATTSQLFPTFIRGLIFPETLVTQGNLVDENLNISTSFAPPFLDMGLIGIVLYGLLFGSAAGVFWFFRRQRYFLLAYAFVAQALALSIFFSFLLALPFLFQLVWFRYLLGRAPPAMPAVVRTSVPG